MFKAVALAALLIASACAKKTDNPAPPPGGSGATPSPTAGTTPSEGTPVTPTPAAAAVAPLNCDTIVSKEMREKYFAGATFKGRPQAVPTSGECEINTADAMASITVDCQQANVDHLEATLKTIKGGTASLPAGAGSAVPEGYKVNAEAMKTKNKELPPGVGRGGFTDASHSIGTMVTVWDDDSNCMAIMLVPPKIDAIAFTKDLLANLPVK